MATTPVLSPMPPRQRVVVAIVAVLWWWSGERKANSDRAATYLSRVLNYYFQGDYRHANVPYWTGAGGVTPPPGSNNGFPQYFACSSGATSGQGTLSAAEAACGSPGSASSVWFPDLRRDETLVDFDIMVKF